LNKPRPFGLVLVRSIAAAAGMLGLAALLGWLFSVPLLKSILPGAVEMKANTAVCFVLSAIALIIFSERRSPVVQYIGQACAVLIAVVGLATMGQYAFGWQLGIDELLFRDTAGAYNTIRGRMSPYSAIALVAAGIALLALPRPSWRLLAWLGALTVLGIGSVTLLGYLWNADELITDQFWPPVALNSAIVFILLSAGIFLSRGAEAAEENVSDGAVEKQVLSGFVGAIILLLAAAGYTYRASADFAQSAQLVSHTQEVRAALAGLYAAVLDSESAQRDYLLTGIARYKNDYIKDVALIDERAQEVRRLIDKNTTQKESFAVLRGLMNDRIEALVRNISIFEEDGLLSAQKAISRDLGSAIMDEIRSMVERMDNLEKTLMTEREAALARTRGTTLVAILFTLALASVLFVYLFHSIRREMRVRARAETEARQANAAKDNFLATMSHEIRTPLSGILGMLELLGISKLDVQQRQFLEAASDSGAGLVRIIDDVLDHAKIEAGKMEIRLEPASIGRTVRRAMATYFAVASAKEIALKDVIDARISPTLLVDSLRLLQILGNFLSNAIKFTEKGYVEIRAEFIDRTAGMETIRFSVSDTGIGITPEAQQRLFQPFEQAAVDSSRMYGGTGLGLAISRRLADMMGGTITMDSERGRGTTMSLSLTLAICEAAPVDDHSSYKMHATGTVLPSQITQAVTTDAPLVLAVDDHPVNRYLLVNQLTSLGLRVGSASSGEEALALWRDGEYSLIISDCNMPGMDGYSLAQAIRRMEAVEGRVRTPIIAWTANVLDSAVSQSRAAGMDDVLIKPAGLPQLKETLARWLSAPVLARSIALDDNEQEPAMGFAGPLDVTQLHKIATGAIERSEILLDFLTQTWSDIQALEQALQKHDPVAIRLIVHRIKGASQIIGARNLVVLCKTIESAAHGGNLEEATELFGNLGAALEQVAAYRGIEDESNKVSK
jgi:signal transduction histidine kinase/DNA-binding NarL/FixJ family response regulator